MYTLAKLLSLSPADKERLGVVHTPAEVSQQPTTWLGTYQKMVKLAPDIFEFLVRVGLDDVSRTPLNVTLIGAGTSDYIGKSVQALLQKEWQCDVQAVPSTDLLTNMEEHVIPGRAYLWISFSRSGDSSEGVAVLETALKRYPKIQHLIVTCNQQGQMAHAFKDNENVFSIVLNDEVNDRGLAMTSSFSNMVIVAQSLAHFRNLDSYGYVLEALVNAALLTLPAAAEVCERLVREGFSKACFLGSGALKGAAVESALKVLELTNGQVMSFAESFLGLRHGPLSAIDSDTLVVGLLSGEERRRAFELDLLQEICDKQLTAKCLSVFPIREEIGTRNRIFLGFQRDLADLYRPPVDVLVGQLLGLFASLREGLKPDTPSPQGAINRVVSHVTIH
jgi:tagatose-6-phosphate ketose/aldose isomerase